MMNVRSHFFILVFFFLSIFHAHSQQIAEYSPVESQFLEVILSDTISKTVCYLPGIHRFGTTPLKGGRFVLVKDGSKNILLLEGTHRVYLAVKHKGQPRLKRIDSTRFTGDNFQLMAFRRKDTLYQYGGSGFWKHRDFICRYREWTHDWEFVSGGDRLENIRTPYQFNEGQDALYVLGSRQLKHSDQTLTYHDSLYRYDFKDKRWSSLGSVLKSFPHAGRPFEMDSLICFSPMGILAKNGDEYLMFDLSSNSIHKMQESVRFRLNALLHQEKAHPNEKPIVLFLKDSLLVFGAGPDPSTGRSIRLTRDDMVLKPDARIYEPVSSNRSRLMAWLMIASAILLTVAAGFILYRRMTGLNAHRFDRTSPVRLSESGLSAKDRQTTIGRPREGEAPDKFLQVDPDKFQERTEMAYLKSNLTPLEWSLLETLITTSAAGRSLDTDAINNIIGVAKKNPMTQKARRSIVISRINKIFSQCVAYEGKLIRRERDAFEKRKYVLFIEEMMAKDLSRKLSGSLI